MPTIVTSHAHIRGRARDACVFSLVASVKNSEAGNGSLLTYFEGALRRDINLIRDVDASTSIQVVEKTTVVVLQAARATGIEYIMPSDGRAAVDVSLVICAAA